MPSKDPIVALSVDTVDDLPSAPIDPSWILEGHPVARAKTLALPVDRTISAIIWDCTAGRFDWHYGGDEIIQIVAGDAELTFADGTVQPVKPGDLIYFPAGAEVVRWHVPTYVRKIMLYHSHVSLPRRLAQRIPFARRLVHGMRTRSLTS